MAVLVEAYSVIIKRDAIASRFLGGWEAFVGIIPNQTACTDGQLVRVGFMSLSDAEYYIDLLKNNGLIYKEEDKFIHIALVLQGKASLALSDWLSVSTIPADGGTVSVCWLGAGITGQEGVVLIPSNMDLATPINWKYEGSMSQTNQHYTKAEMRELFTCIKRDENGVETYKHKDSGKIVYVGVTKKDIK